jgi:hypothetical protein
MSSEEKLIKENININYDDRSTKMLGQIEQIKEKQKQTKLKTFKYELKDINEEERKKYNLSDEFMESFSFCKKNKEELDDNYKNKFLIIQKDKIVEISNNKEEIFNLYNQKYQNKGIYIYNAGQKMKNCLSYTKFN